VAMRPITSVIDFVDALRTVVAAATPIERTEMVPLLDADGRVVARDVLAAGDVPPFDRAAMDGYAVVAADTAGATSAAPRSIRIVGSVYSGHSPARGISSGECVEIATGAPMPPGADAVIMVEETTRDHDVVRVAAAVTPRQNIGRRGADLTAGEAIVRAGDVLTPGRIGALAATGVIEVGVFARPTVALLSTGDEIVQPGQPLAPGQIYDINRFTLETIVTRHGGVGVAMPAAADTIDDLVARVDAARTQDVVVFSGGSSVGERDLILDVIARRGELVFRGVAVKPGKPTIFARVGGTPFFGMPGYPASCLSNAYMLLVPFVRKMARLPAWQPRTLILPLSRRIVSAAGRHQFYTVRVVNGTAEPAFKASGDITSMARADGFIEIPAATDAVDEGTPVMVKFF
jgi:molybdopterin molybdotransferase